MTFVSHRLNFVRIYIVQFWEKTEMMAKLVLFRILETLCVLDHITVRLYIDGKMSSSEFNSIFSERLVHGLMSVVCLFTLVVIDQRQRLANRYVLKHVEV